MQAELLDATSQPIIAVGLDRVIIYWNRAAAAMYGWSAAEAVGRTAADVMGRAQPPDEAQAIHAAMARGEVWRGEFEVERRDGARLLVRVTNRPVFDRHGNLAAVISAAVDVSRRTADDDARRQLAAIVGSSADAIFSSTTDGIVTSWNASAERLFGFTADEMIGESVTRYVPVDRLDEQAHMRARLCAGGGAERVETVRSHKDGRRVAVAITASPTTDEQGNVVGISVIARDITERNATQHALETSERRFEASFEQSGVGKVIAGLDGVPLRINAAAAAILGRPAAELVGQRMIPLMHPDDVPLGHMVLARLAEGYDTYDDERRFLRPDGSIIWASTHVTLVRDPRGEPQYLSAQLQDITARKQLEQELVHQSLHDPMTGLPNRALFIDRVIHDLSTGRRRVARLAVLYLDVDRLQAINEAFGHDFGDDTLRRVGRQIADAVRPGDTVARCSGDEFAILCEDISQADVEQVARRVLDAVSQPAMHDGQPTRVTASLGIALADEHATADTLLRDAAVAMHRAKERGRDRHELFDVALRSKVAQRMTSESALRRGLERDEFIVHYQPVIDLATGAMVSAEALVRWERPGHGLVAPGEFIPLAEETGFIVPLGAFVLERACDQLVEWQRTDPTMSVAVNLSVSQLTSPGLTGRIESVLQRTGLPASSLHLELTESIFMDEVAYFGPLLAKLRALGVRLSIDDFGTGYSSLCYLKSFPVDAVKIDRSFVDALGSESDSTALVAAIIAIADALDLQVTAEGVETKEQLARLRDLHCERAQGFYLARPMPADELSKVVASAKCWAAA